MLLNAARDVAVEAAKGYFAARATPASSAERINVIDVTPEPPGCPYCQVALHLAGARLYWARATAAKGDLVAVYRDLACQQVQQSLNQGRPLPSNLTNRTLLENIRTLYGDLLAMGTLPQWDSALSQIDRLINRAMDLAESTDGGR